MNLFWYPAIHYGKLFDGKYNKQMMLDSYVRYFLARLQCMFKYDGLPDTIPQKWLEHYLLCNGNCIIARGKGDELYAFVGGMGTKINTYYVPGGYIVANPYFNAGVYPDTDSAADESYSKEFINGHDCVLIYNDTYSQGVLPMLHRYCTQLVENDITISIADILARATLNISTADDKTKASAELYLKRLRDGDLAVLSEKAFIEGLNVREFSAASNSITNLIELHQYIKASLFNELGLNSNYNMKRESINSNESQLNDDMLHPLIDNMLKERQMGLDKVNEMFGTNITVSFDSAWLENEKEEQMILSGVDNEDNTNSFDSVDDNNDVDSVDGIEEDEVIEDEAEMQVVEAESDTIEDNIEPNEETPTELVDAIEELTEAVEEIADAITDDEVMNDDGNETD